MVVTPLISSSFAKPYTMRYATARVRAEPIIFFTSFSLSRCFFCGLPLPARCTCILISPGMIYFPPRSIFSYPAGTFRSDTMSVIFSPSVRMHSPAFGCISFVPSRIMPPVNAYFI